LTAHPFEQLFHIYDAGLRYGPPDSVYVPGNWPMRRVRPTAVPLVTRGEVTSGFFEPLLIDAALVIAQKAHRLGTYDIAISLDDFEDPTGFLHLLNYGAGWVLAGAPDMLRVSRENPREFVPTASFWGRLVGQPQEAEKKT
jgi:hypothetical protein